MQFDLAALSRQFFSKTRSFLLEELNEVARTKFEEAKNELLLEVFEHPISQELDTNSSNNGPSSSQFLDGVKGNLYSFLGFQEGTNPAKELIKFLDAEIQFKPADSLIESVKSLRLKNCAAYLPARGQFDEALPLVWQPGRSWPHAIEEGISGLGYYLFIFHQASRSGRGIESPAPVRSVTFRPTLFLSPILERFRKRLKE